MPINNSLVVAVSSGALFDAELKNEEENDLQEGASFFPGQEKEILKPGPGFRLIKALLSINSMIMEEKKIEIIIISRDSADESLRIFNSIEYYGLDITRAAIVGDVDISPYLAAYKTDIFLSANEDDVRQSMKVNIASGILCNYPEAVSTADKETGQIKIAFASDAINFSSESEQLYQTYGIKAFLEYEKQNALKQTPDGPYAKLIKMISFLQKKFPREEVPIRTALISMSNDLSYERIVLALRAWDVKIDEAFFLSGGEKHDVLKAFGTDIFFNGQALLRDKPTRYVTAGIPFAMSV